MPRRPSTRLRLAATLAVVAGLCAPGPARADLSFGPANLSFGPALLAPAEIPPELASAAAAGCAKPDAAPSTPALPVAKVRVAPVQAAQIPRLTEVTGTSEA